LSSVARTTPPPRPPPPSASTHTHTALTCGTQQHRLSAPALHVCLQSAWLSYLTHAPGRATAPLSDRRIILRTPSVGSYPTNPSSSRIPARCSVGRCQRRVLAWLAQLRSLGCHRRRIRGRGWKRHVAPWPGACLAPLFALGVRCMLPLICRLNHPLRAACCLLHVACCVRHVVCCTLHVACGMLSVACMSRVACLQVTSVSLRPDGLDGSEVTVSFPSSGVAGEPDTCVNAGIQQHETESIATVNVLHAIDDGQHADRRHPRQQTFAQTCASPGADVSEASPGADVRRVSAQM
jgi:hypothetical protein